MKLCGLFLLVILADCAGYSVGVWRYVEIRNSGALVSINEAPSGSVSLLTHRAGRPLERLPEFVNDAC